MRKYIKPKTEVIKIDTPTLLAVSRGGRCDSSCKIWHICRDRENYKENNYCKDKEYE